jgi:hypothetical protein
LAPEACHSAEANAAFMASLDSKYSSAIRYGSVSARKPGTNVRVTLAISCRTSPGTLSISGLWLSKYFCSKPSGLAGLRYRAMYLIT